VQIPLARHPLAGLPKSLARKLAQLRWEVLSRPAQTDAQRQQVQQLRTETRGIMLNVAQLAQKYDAAIAQLAQQVQPQREKWSTDIQAIVAKNAIPEQQQKLASFGGRAHGFGRTRRYFRPAVFLLLDPNAPGPAERGPGSTSFYPNPAAATSQLEYEVKKSGPVTIDLLDSNGTKLRTLLAETKQEKGSRTQQLDLHDLPAGTYFYKITTKAGSETKRFVKE
ncbi:MAG: T9SS type A sorting domain-containing protein, partial [Hymenobacter sp.]|nr:T9SS type A sorting domain-containing protein [Hymenobacter sp.]